MQGRYGYGVWARGREGVSRVKGEGWRGCGRGLRSVSRIGTCQCNVLQRQAPKPKQTKPNEKKVENQVVPRKAKFKQKTSNATAVKLSGTNGVQSMNELRSHNESKVSNR